MALHAPLRSACNASSSRPHLSARQLRWHKQHRHVSCQAAHTFQSNDLVAGYTTSGSELFEVIEGWSDGAALLTWKGRLLRLQESTEDGGGLTLTPAGVYPATTSLAGSFSAKLQNVLEKLHEHGGTPPATLTHAERVGSLGELRDAVRANPSFWRDGLSPKDPPRTEMQQLLSTAGELAALVEGQRGVVIVQLWNGWDPSRGQPLYDPFVIVMLERALTTPDVKVLISEAPGGVGLSAVLFADKEPYSAWALHLCSFGCQANAVAGSTYYKLLVGRLLGYKADNVRAYAQAMDGFIPPQMEQQVEADLKKLSKAKAKIPWNVAGSRGKKAKPAAAAAKKRR